MRQNSNRASIMLALPRHAAISLDAITDHCRFPIAQ